MNYKRLLASLSILIFSFLWDVEASPNNRINFNGQELWLNGSNLAWVDFSRDFGPGSAQLSEFEMAFKELWENGGNTMRIWLHTNGVHTPVWSENTVTGPGPNTIENLTNILNLAEQYDISLMLTLWSFDMLRATNSPSVLARNHAILTQQISRETYINNALIPMVEAVKDHPALLAWEIFNEAEGMSQEFGWSITTNHVPMADIQAFINQTAGAIRNTDPNALITNGALSFYTISDIYTNPLHFNYYRDDRLIQAGGQSDGVLDFYTVHHYGHSESPFVFHASYFQATKPIAITEFFIQGNEGSVTPENYYLKLHENGYAGALSWQWVDWRQNRENNQITWINTLLNTQKMFNQHQEDVELSYANKPIWKKIVLSEDSIEEGFSVSLSWQSRYASIVTLNGDQVTPFGKITISPEVTTDYTFVFIDSDGAEIIESVRVTVIPSDEINRILDAQGFFDENMRWLYYDLRKSYGIQHIELDFTSIPVADIHIESSFDALNWTSIRLIQNPIANYYDLAFEEPEHLKFLRISSDDSFALNQIKAFGLLSEEQPPVVNVIYPLNGQIFNTTETIRLLIEGREGTGSFSGLYFHINGSEVYWKRFRPFFYDFTFTEPGEYIIQGEVRDSQFGSFFSKPISITVQETNSVLRLEAENAVLSQGAVIQENPDASNGFLVYMQGSGSIKWNIVNIPSTNTYRVKFGYYLNYDYKEQYLYVNDVRVDTLAFTTPVESFLEIEKHIFFLEGNNTISLSAFWGWMSFDYIEVVLDNENVSIDYDNEVIVSHKLGNNYPNPFNPSTSIPYSLSHADFVTIEVFDLMGRRLISNKMGLQQAGNHFVTIDGSSLSSGMYFYRLSTSNFVQTKKMLLIK